MKTSNPTWETIADNVDLYAVPDSGNDIVAVIAFNPVGGAMESRADAGLLSFMGRLLQRGTKKRTNAELAETIDGLGLTLAFAATEDYSYHQMVTTADALEESIALFAETLFEPSFEPDEIEKERQSTLAAIRRSDDDLMGLTVRHLFEELYPRHGYGLPQIGVTESIGELTREQIINCHEEVCASPFRVVAVGNFQPDHLKTLLLQELVRRKASLQGEPLLVSAPRPAHDKSAQILRDSEQAYLVAGFAAPHPTSPDYMAARLLNTVLGEGMSSRLFQALREEKGLAYATGSNFSGMKLSGTLFGYIGTKPESLDTAREGMLAEFERIRTELVPEDELLRAKNYMIGRFLIDHQRNFKRAFYLGHFDQMGLGSEMDQNFPNLVTATTAEQVQTVAEKLLKAPVIIELRPE